MANMITPGDICTVSHDIVIDGELAFREGERVTVETVAPNPEMPQFKYTVYSPLLKLRYQLSDSNISPEAAPPAPPVVSPVIAPPSQPVPAKKRRGLSKNAKYVIVGVVALFVMLVIIVALVGEPEKKESGKKEEPSTSTAEAEVDNDKKSLEDFTEEERKQIYWDNIAEQDKVSFSDPEYNKKMEQATETVANKWGTTVEVCNAIAIEAIGKNWPLPEPELQPPPAEPTSAQVPDPNQYPAGSADRVFAEYLEAWGAQDWNRMYGLTQLTWRDKSDPMEIQADYDWRVLKTAEITGRSGVSEPSVGFTENNCVDFTANISYEFGSELRTEVMKARVICESAPQQPDPNGTWGVNPTSCK